MLLGEELRKCLTAQVSLTTARIEPAAFKDKLQPSDEED